MRVLFLALSILGVVRTPTLAATAVATYCFDNTFEATQSTAPALFEIDPLNASDFITDSVFGETRTVWSFDGNELPLEEQAGLALETEGLISPTSYSVDMVLLFTQRENAWRSIMNVENRMSDNGFYVSPGNQLYVYPQLGAGATWTNNEYHHVTLTNNGTMVSTYLDGEVQFELETILMNLNNLNNPELLMHFIIDNNLAGPAANEFSDGKLALIRIWDSPLTASEVGKLAENPFIVPGDYNGDYFVDAADYVVWRKNVGTTNPLLSDLIGGEIGEAHYEQWKKYFGEMGCPPLPEEMAETVPEPRIQAAIIGSTIFASLTARRRMQTLLKHI